MKRYLLALAAAGGAAIALVSAAPFAIGAGSSATVPEGSIVTGSVHSAALGEDIAYNAYLPPGYETSGERYPVLYLLHGRGDSMSAWLRIKGTLDELIAVGEIPPTIAVMPDAPWSSRASYYVDSAYRGSDPGRPVETAFITELVPHVDATYRTMAGRTGRAVGGYSMGGYGAMRYSLVYPQLFGAAIVLSPAVYFPLPPADSSAREFGAFGKGNRLFVDSIYRRLNYPSAFEAFEAAEQDVHMFIAVGDDEFKNTNPRDFEHDLDFEAHVLFNKASRVDHLPVELRVLDGGHDWDVWEPAFVEGARHIFRLIGRPPARLLEGTLLGTAGEERAGGVAIDSTGNVYQALAAEGSLNGQPHSGAKDVFVVKTAPGGAPVWTRALGTPGTERAYGVALDPAGNVVVTGYTTGNLDGTHAGNTTDDVFVAKFAPDGTQQWLVQFGAASVADRGYALDTDADGSIYVGGYTRGALEGTNQGDKDVYLAKLSPTGAQLWLRQIGSVAEDKAWGVAVSGSGVYVAGMTAGALGTPLGSTDGFLARYDAAGAQSWLQQFGTSAVEEAWSVAADAAGNAYVTGYSGGDFAAPLVGDKDLVVARFDPSGVVTWKDQLGTDLNDKGAAVRLDEAGNVYVAGFTDGNLGVGVGGFDLLLAKYAPDTTRVWAEQLGTTADDGADAFAEASLYLAIRGDTLYVSGLTAGDVGGQAALGNGDVFLGEVAADDGGQ